MIIPQNAKRRPRLEPGRRSDLAIYQPSDKGCCELSFTNSVINGSANMSCLCVYVNDAALFPHEGGDGAYLSNAC